MSSPERAFCIGGPFDGLWVDVKGEHLSVPYCIGRTFDAAGAGNGVTIDQCHYKLHIIRFAPSGKAQYYVPEHTSLQDALLQMTGSYRPTDRLT